ncbi:phytanoyl-CoA dioxygenase family protein [Sphingomonas bacterium]|uniref:phytanoyl-CoA dioxygenase family protein n=1 Tax=Sphingomonas bacterium TaxID=1895847 RepID=UPI001576F8B4|nr:phytanoyl-CoA dioxygenase family protein [Sphingomonas bacterium]
MSVLDLKGPSWFNPAHYLESNPDVSGLEMEPYTHWLQHGREEERLGQRRPWFAPRFADAPYLAVYPDIQPLIEIGLFVSAAEHWVAAGREEMRTGHRPVPVRFDELAYLASRPDVARAVSDGVYLNGFDHWLQWGASEGGGADVPAGWEAAAESHFDAGNFEASIAADKAAFWARNGYLILEGAISPEACDRLNRKIDRVWIDRRVSAPRVSIDVYLERADGARIPMSAAPGEARALPYKLNDMFLVDDDARALALHDDVVAALRWVLKSEPTVIGSLNFERGSTQKFHTDTLYMPGKTAGGMTAAWFALEDVTAEAGPLKYYPGSHQIPLFRFSSGRPSQINEQVTHYDAYMTRQVKDRGLEWRHFLPKKGDVLIWHERLYHGGAAIEDIAQTRKSLVVHYWRAAEMNQGEIIKYGNGYYWNRPPLG